MLEPEIRIDGMLYLGYHWICLSSQILNLPPLPIFGVGVKYIIFSISHRLFENVNDICTGGDSSKRVLFVRRLIWIIGGYRVQL